MEYFNGEELKRWTNGNCTQLQFEPKAQTAVKKHIQNTKVHFRKGPIDVFEQMKSQDLTGAFCGIT